MECDFFIERNVYTSAINDGETQGTGLSLLLIHGQMGDWEDYACVLPASIGG